MHSTTATCRRPTLMTPLAEHWTKRQRTPVIGAERAAARKTHPDCTAPRPCRAGQTRRTCPTRASRPRRDEVSRVARPSASGGSGPVGRCLESPRRQPVGSSVATSVGASSAGSSCFGGPGGVGVSGGTCGSCSGAGSGRSGSSGSRGSDSAGSVVMAAPYPPCPGLCTPGTRN
jgi:hypothetical protein